MNKRVNTLIAVLLVFSFTLSACAAPTATPVPPTPVPPTATSLPPTPTPEPTPVPVVAIDYQTLFADLVAEIPAEKGYGTVSAAKLNEELVENPPFLLDVREASEIETAGYIEGGEHIPVREVLANLGNLPAKDVPIVIYCASGHRGAFVFAALKLLGWTDVRNLGGGFGAWAKAGLPVVTGTEPAPEPGTPADVDPELYAELNDFFTNLPANFDSIKAADLNAKMSEETVFLLDVRRADEATSNGYINGSVNIPLENLFIDLGELPADKDAPIVIYCVSGHRGAVAAMGLRMVGYTNVLNLGGGFNAWKGASLPVAGWVDWTMVWTDFLTNLPTNYYSISATGLNEKLAESTPFMLDVRQPTELEANGYIEGAVNIPVRDVLKNLDKLPAQDQTIVIYCGSGHRGALVMAALRFLGYSDVVNLGGGLGAWTKAGLPVVTGSMPAEPSAGTAPAVDATRLEELDAFLSGLPDNYYSFKAADLNAQMAEAAPFILDVRTAEELTTDGYIEGSVNIPVTEVMGRLAELPTDKAAPIVVLCKSGHRGALVMMSLRMIGYTDVLNLGGGLGAWLAASLPVVK